MDFSKKNCAICIYAERSYDCESRGIKGKIFCTRKDTITEISQAENCLVYQEMLDPRDMD